ncbi:mycothiol acetyltransferase domain protein [Mycobacterium kansasii]|uniref:Mycothiol acetyltransferase domain protein n=1 Tax=Mycobacterium kansasii TaxID=1768 RepID=A0A1V3WUP4_MYCKA|nr:mycothiol acetyltransferase domain protein [Mycobacterium kansasii]
MRPARGRTAVAEPDDEGSGPIPQISRTRWSTRCAVSDAGGVALGADSRSAAGSTRNNLGGNRIRRCGAGGRAGAARIGTAAHAPSGGH